MKISGLAFIVRNIIPDMLAVIPEFPFLMVKPVKADKKYQQSDYPESDFQIPSKLRFNRLFSVMPAIAKYKEVLTKASRVLSIAISVLSIARFSRRIRSLFRISFDFICLFQYTGTQ